MFKRLMFLTSVIIVMILAVCGHVQGEVIQETLYETSFDTPGAVDDWEVVSGTWELDSDAGTYTGSGSERILSIYQGPLADGSKNADLRNYVVRAELQRNNVAGGLAGRYMDAENYYLFRHHPNARLEIYAIASSGNTLLGTEPFPNEDLPEKYVLSFEMVGTTLTGKLLDGDIELASLTVEDNAFPNGAAGMRIWSATQVYHDFALIGLHFPSARMPDPPDGSLHENTWVTLSWSSGDYAVSHDVYLGDDQDAVINATPDSDVFRGNQATTFYVTGLPGYAFPEGLVPGTTYYWRIDEVNEANPESPWKGNVWSFSIPPKKAYNPSPADGAEFVDPNNTILSWTPGLGAILHTIYLGNDFEEVSNATGGTVLGSATYQPGPLELETVYYWRVDEFDTAETYKGDVWSFTTPGAVGNPQPAHNATDVPLNTILSWTPAVSAASHELYFGTNKEAVRNADTSAPEYKGSIELDAENYDPGLLDAESAYYWRVDEVDSQGNVSKGPIWLFTTGTFLLVDGFERYTDDDTAGEAIWQTWIDGFGVADNGAQVGNLIPPYCEQTIVHGGAQSMPLFYVNEAGVTNSEVVLPLSATGGLRDWTQASVTDLSLWFRGASGNAAEPLYVSVSNPPQADRAPAVVAHDDPSTATIRSWKQWRIPLQVFADQGINLTNVDKIAIGLGTKAGVASSGGSGTIYIDDICLYQ
jgi:hypothetical protein